MIAGPFWNCCSFVENAGAVAPAVWLRLRGQIARGDPHGARDRDGRRVEYEVDGVAFRKNAGVAARDAETADVIDDHDVLDGRLRIRHEDFFE